MVYTLAVRLDSPIHNLSVSIQTNVRSMMESRQTSIARCRCSYCDWQGLEKDLVHTYKPVPFTTGDVEPVSNCPICGNEVMEIEETTHS